MWTTEALASDDEWCWLIAPNGQAITSMGAEQGRILAEYLNKRTTFNPQPNPFVRA